MDSNLPIVYTLHRVKVLLQYKESIMENYNFYYGFYRPTGYLIEVC